MIIPHDLGLHARSTRKADGKLLRGVCRSEGSMETFLVSAQMYQTGIVVLWISFALAGLFFCCSANLSPFQCNLPLKNSSLPCVFNSLPICY